MALPLADPQFWLVTAGAALALGLVVRKLRRRTSAEAERGCDRCPKPGNPLAPPPAAPRGPRRLGALAALMLGAAGAVAAETVERQVAAMGTTLRVEVEVITQRGAALELAEAMIDEVAATEARLSTWRDDSDLSRVNRAPVGEWVETAAHDELAAAADCWRDTGGLFHPGVGRLVAAWDLRGVGRVPTPAELEEARRGLAGPGIEAANRPGSARRNADVLLEEGGFGKGAGLDAATAVLEKAASTAGRAFVRLGLGGQVSWANAERPVVVALADPRDRARPVLELTLSGRRGSLAVSGNSEKQFTVNGKSFGHLLDPRTGLPATDFGAVAVIAPGALRADCLSTALFVMGPDAGERWLASQREALEVAFLVVDGDELRARLTPSLARRARPLVAELVIEALNGSS